MCLFELDRQERNVYLKNDAKIHLIYTNCNVEMAIQVKYLIYCQILHKKNQISDIFSAFGKLP